jgi:hypothetical protein
MEEPNMHLIQVQSTEEPFKPAQRKQITSTLTDPVVSIERENLCRAEWIDIENLLSDEWDIGGPAMTANTLRDLVAGK